MKHFLWRPLALALWALALILLLNHDFGVLTTTAGQMGANDVASVVDGYHKTPHFWIGCWNWWHGPWIQSGVQVFRPLSSMMLWWECFVGFHYGFIYVAWWGVFLFCIACALTMTIAWRLTQSWLCVAVAATLVPALRFWNWVGTTPASWLAWMPIHHDLLMIIGLLAAFQMFCRWLGSGQRRHLLGCWVALVLGALSKEYVYIFPLIALIWGLGAPEKAVSRAQMLRAVATMGAFILSLFLYRHAVLPDPYNPPPIKWVHIKKRPFLYWFGPFYPFVLTGMWWAVAQALSVLIVLGFWLRAWKNKTRVWPTLLTFAAIYLPVFTYLGWHYTLTGAFVRGAVWWPIVAHLVARDIAGWLPTKSVNTANAPEAVVLAVE